MPGHHYEGYALLRAHNDEEGISLSSYSPNTASSMNYMPLTPLTPLTPSGLEFDESESMFSRLSIAALCS